MTFEELWDRATSGGFAEMNEIKKRCDAYNLLHRKDEPSEEEQRLHAHEAEQYRRRKAEEEDEDDDTGAAGISLGDDLFKSEPDDPAPESNLESGGGDFGGAGSGSDY